MKAQTATADRVVDSVFACCAVGCAQLVYVKDGKIPDIEGASLSMAAAATSIALPALGSAFFGGEEGTA